MGNETKDEGDQDVEEQEEEREAASDVASYEERYNARKSNAEIRADHLDGRGSGWTEERSSAAASEAYGRGVHPTLAKQTQNLRWYINNHSKNYRAASPAPAEDSNAQTNEPRGEPDSADATLAELEAEQQYTLVFGTISEKSAKDLWEVGRNIRSELQGIEANLRDNASHISPEELAAYVDTLADLCRAFSVGHHYFLPNVVRGSITNDVDFQHAMAYRDFVFRLNKTVGRAVGMVTVVYASGSIVDAQKLDHATLQKVLVALGDSLGNSPMLADLAIQKTLEHGHLSLNAGADMMWALGVVGDAGPARQLFAAAGPLAMRYAKDEKDSTKLAKILWACGALGFQRQAEPFLKAMASLSAAQLDAFDLHQIADVAWACTKLRAGAPNANEGMKYVLEHFADRLLAATSRLSSSSSSSSRNWDAESCRIVLPAGPSTNWEEGNRPAALADDADRQSLSHSISCLSLLQVPFPAKDLSRLLKICGAYRPSPSPLRGISLAPMFDPERARDKSQGGELAFHTKPAGANSAISGRMRQVEKADLLLHHANAQMALEEGIVEEWPEAGAAKKAKMYKDQMLLEKWDVREKMSNGTWQLHLVVQVGELLERMEWIAYDRKRDVRTRLAELAEEALDLIAKAESEPEVDEGTGEFMAEDEKSTEDIADSMGDIFAVLDMFVGNETSQAGSKMAAGFSNGDGATLEEPGNGEEHEVHKDNLEALPFEVDEDGWSEMAGTAPTMPVPTEADRPNVLACRERLRHIVSQTHRAAMRAAHDTFEEGGPPLGRSQGGDSSGASVDKDPLANQGKRFAGIRLSTESLRRRALWMGLLHQKVEQVDYRSLKRPELVMLCAHYNLSKQGTLPELIERLDKFAVNLAGSVYTARPQRPRKPKHVNEWDIDDGHHHSGLGADAEGKSWPGKMK